LPAEIGNLSNLTTLYLEGNQLTALPTEIGNLAKLDEMLLDWNQLSSLPPEIGNLSSLTSLGLYSNNLSRLPAEFSNLTQVHLGIGDNRISTTDPVLRAFLDARAGNWADTQRVAPTPITTTVLSHTSVQLNWKPLPLQIMDAYYEISIAAEGEGFVVYGITTSIAEDSYIIDGLSPATTYEIRLRTYTPAHEDNQNALWSEYSAAVSVATEGIE